MFAEDFQAAFCVGEIAASWRAERGDPAAAMVAALLAAGKPVAIFPDTVDFSPGTGTESLILGRATDPPLLVAEELLRLVRRLIARADASAFQALAKGPVMSISSHSPPTAMGFRSCDRGYRFQHGTFDITVLSDGTISIPDTILVPAEDPEQRRQVLARLPISDGQVEMRTNVPLIRTGTDVIIVDVGAGDRYQPTDGKLTGSLAVNGVHPESITKVVFTHAHPDHIWGTLNQDGSLRFPNATYYVGEAEWSFWMDPDYETNLPPVLHDFARGAQRDLGAVRDRLVLLRPGHDVVTGFRALDTAGHTPGHMSFELSGEDGLIITADATTNQIVALEHPGWTFGYDALPELAILNRIRLVDRAATDRLKLLGYHWAYPGIGYVEKRGGAARFVAAA